ncbi:hypothetical protein AABB24_002900 [Solanum stoloniferum]|uniref:Uncharacterized protein n=2 Tax=Solanum TaxID=4107 RepID=A0AAF0Q0W8_SOLVR|nr:uncharacterized protein LOC125825198 [Solanum verrucosum]WMV14641.1 hypothetical protein MTR67_008026 [Solanum verrucosum]
METPSSTTTSKLIVIKESEKKEMTKKSALFDITNGSPIVGLATGILKTPSSAVSRSTQGRKCCTPGSGEALLRGQVKNLLQMVEEEAEISLGKRTNIFHVEGLVAPTPANTPLMDLSANELLPPVTASPVEDTFVISQILNKIVYEGKKKQESVESETSVTRSLLLDFCDKSESSVDGEEEIDELCEAISSMNVNGGGQKFAGKRIKFVYNSDDEFVGVEEEFAASPERID